MKEIYTLTIKCIDGAYWTDEFSWVVEVPVDMTLQQLHTHIQDQTLFEDDHLAAFFTARDMYARKRDWLIDPDEGTGWRRTLSTIYPLDTGQRLFYLFDFGDNWLFSIGKRAKPKPLKTDEHYPNVIKQSGSIPEQYPDFDDE